MIITDTDIDYSKVLKTNIGKNKIHIGPAPRPGDPVPPNPPGFEDISSVIAPPNFFEDDAPVFFIAQGIVEVPNTDSQNFLSIQLLLQVQEVLKRLNTLPC